MESNANGSWVNTIGVKITRKSGEVIELGTIAQTSYHPNTLINSLWQMRDYLLNTYYKLKIKKLC
jgi:hypothetical protein